MDSEGCLYPSSRDNLSTDLGCVLCISSSANFLHVHSTKHVWCVTPFTHYTLVDESNLLYREANVLYWAKALLKLTYDFIDRAINDASVLPLFEIPCLHFIDAGLMLAYSFATVTTHTAVGKIWWWYSQYNIPCWGAYSHILGGKVHEVYSQWWCSSLWPFWCQSRWDCRIFGVYATCTVCQNGWSSVHIRLSGYVFLAFQLCELNYISLIQAVVYFWQTHKSSHICKWFDLLPSCELSPTFLVMSEEVWSFLVMGMWRMELLFLRSSIFATNFASGPAFGCMLLTIPIPLNQCSTLTSGKWECAVMTSQILQINVSMR